MSTYKQNVEAADQLINDNGTNWGSINPEYAARMKMQNRFCIFMRAAYSGLIEPQFVPLSLISWSAASTFCLYVDIINILRFYVDN